MARHVAARQRDKDRRRRQYEQRAADGRPLARADTSAALLLPDGPAGDAFLVFANFGAIRRYTFDPDSGKPNLFVSGYTNKIVPNLWDRSAEVRLAG